MKPNCTHHRLALAAWALASAFALADEPKPSPRSDSAPSIQTASVTLPYSELRALWEAAQANRAPKADEAPAPWVIHDAEIRLKIKGQAIAVEATFAGQTFGKKWQRIPLIGGDVSLVSAEAGDCAMVWDDGYAALTKQEGKFSAALQLAADLPDKLEKGAVVRLKLPAATIKRLSVSGLPAGVDVTVGDRAPVRGPDGSAFFPLGSAAQEVAARFASAAPVKATLPSQWKVESQTLAIYSDGRLRLENRVFARAEDGSAQEIELLLPRTSGGIAIEGDDLDEWRVVRSDEGFRRVSVRWKTRDQLDRELTIAYTIPQSPLDAEWAVPAIRTAETKDSRNFFAVASAEAVQLSAPTLRSGGEARLLPEWMRPRVGSLPFATAEAQGDLALQAKWLPELKTAEARISESSCALRLVADGSMQTTASYTICHQSALPWQIDLPPQVELLICDVGGRSVRPLLLGDNKMELILPAPSGSRTSETKVTLVYAAKEKPLDPVSGQLTLALPRTALFIDRLDWAISIPDAYEPTAVSGNLSAAPPATAGEKRDERLISLRKDLCRGETPVAEIFYQRRTARD